MEEDFAQALILEHYRKPRAKGALPEADFHLIDTDSRTGDLMELWLKCDTAGVIMEVGFEGQGSAIAVASASMLCAKLQGLTLAQAHELSGKFRAMLNGVTEPDETELGELAALAGIRHLPARVACALRVWNALDQVLN